MVNTKDDIEIESQEPMHDRSRAIGGILVEQGRLNSREVDEIQRYAKGNNIRFGDAAVQLQMLTRYDVDLAIAQQFKYPVLTCGGEGGVGADVIAAYDPQSEMVESLRILRSQLTLRWLKGASRKILTIASPARGEGRSWVAANLATMFAQLGERTLLIDADFRHPSQHRYFNLENSVGLAELLTGRAGREIVCRIHPRLRLFLLTTGNLPPNPQELLGGSVFDAVLNLFAEQYDIVLLDTPAAAETADAQILAARAGAAIIIARRNYTRHAQLLAAMGSFTEIGVNVIGSVMNDYNR